MPLPDFNNIVDLIKKGATVEAQEKIMALRTDVLALQDENLALKRRVSELESTGQHSAEMEFRKPFYFKANDEQPFCPICWEKDKTALHLIGPYDAADGTYFKCSKCPFKHKIKDRGYPRMQIVRE